MLSSSTTIDAGSRRLIVDEFATLYLRRQARAPETARFEALTDQIRSWHPDLAANLTAIEVGTVYDVQVGEKTIEKSWTSMAAVYKAAGGLKPFLVLCSVTFKALSEKLGIPAAEALQVESQVGPRRLKAVTRVVDLMDLPIAA